MPGRFSRVSAAGTNRLRFTGRVAGKALAPGTYRLVAVPTLAGRKGAAATVRFRIVARRAR